MITNNITPEMKEKFHSSFLFRGISSISEEIESQLLSTAEFFSRGECVYESTNFRKALGIIIFGKVRVTTSDEKSKVILRDMDAGETFGAAALFGAGELYVSTIRAKTRCAVVFIDESTLTELFTLRPEISVNYISFLSSKIRYLNGKIAELSTRGAEEKLLDYMQKCTESGKKVKVGGMSALAKTLNIGRSSLYRALSSLEDRGIIFKNGDEWETVKEKN